MAIDNSTGSYRKLGRSSLSFELPLVFLEAVAYRKANGQYVRKNQWRDTYGNSVYRP